MPILRIFINVLCMNLSSSTSHCLALWTHTLRIAVQNLKFKVIWYWIMYWLGHFCLVFNEKYKWKKYIHWIHSHGIICHSDFCAIFLLIFWQNHCNVFSQICRACVCSNVWHIWRANSIYTRTLEAKHICMARNRIWPVLKQFVNERNS